MRLRIFVFAAFAMLLAMLVPSAAHAGSSARSRERVPSPHTTLVPAVIVLAAIGATVARMNRRGGPR